MTNDNSDRIENSGEVKGKEMPNERAGRILTLVTIDRIFELFAVYGKSEREICKYLGIRKQHVEYALRCKVIQLREAGLPRTGFGKPIQRAVVSMPARNRGVAA